MQDAEGNRSNDEEARRLEALRSYLIVDTEEEAIFDALTSIAAHLLEVPIALISLVDDTRQWFKSHHGIEARETPREISFCAHAILGSGPFVVADASADERFVDNPLVTDEPHVRFYVGIPLITPDGHALGTLCAIDRKPRQLSPAELRSLHEIAKMTMHTLELHRRMQLVKQALADRSVDDQRKMLLASMVVHDLRSPLGVIAAAASLGLRQAGSDAEEILQAFQDVLMASTRMEGMLSDGLDLCLAEAGRLILRPNVDDLASLVALVAGELRRVANEKGCPLRVTAAPKELMFSFDRDLIRRVLSNLIDNAIKFSPAGKPIEVSLVEAEQNGKRVVELRVEDRAATIPASDALQIFEALKRGRATMGEPGYGLGLAFCQMAAEAHGATIACHPRSGGGNCFTLRFALDG